MSAPINNTPQNLPNISGNSGNQKAVSELKQQIINTTSETMTALQDLTEELSGKIKIDDPNKSSKKDPVDQKEALKSEAKELVDAELAATIAAQEEIDKKKRKKKKFDEKLKTLASILDQIDPSQLDEDEQNEMKKSKDLLKKLDHFNRKLDILEREEDTLETLLEKTKKNPVDPSSSLDTPSTAPPTEQDSSQIDPDNTPKASL